MVPPVGEDIVSEKDETMADVRSSDVRAQRPHSRKTYAQAARKEVKRGQVSFESETRKNTTVSLSRNNPT